MKKKTWESLLKKNLKNILDNNNNVYNLDQYRKAYMKHKYATDAQVRFAKFKYNEFYLDDKKKGIKITEEERKLKLEMKKEAGKKLREENKAKLKIELQKAKNEAFLQAIKISRAV